MKQSIVITGGHTTPALAVMEELLDRGVSVSYIGRTHAFSEAQDRRSFEYELVKAYPVTFIASSAPRFPVGWSIQLFAFPFQFLYTLMQSLGMFMKKKPDVIVSFGGYISAPVVVAGWLRSIPVVMHEQTMVPGRANRVLAQFADVVCISWKSSKKHFPVSVQSNCVHTGNPLRKEIRSAIKKRTTRTKPAALYITGGSTGAHRVNTIVGQLVPDLIKTYRVMHQCGDSQFNDFDMLTSVKNSLPENDQKKYDVAKYVDSARLSKIFASTDIMIGRSGANTIAELVCLGIPSILIPLPESAYAEQQVHAQYLSENGSAIVLSPEESTPEQLRESIDQITQNYTTYIRHARTIAQSEDAQAHTAAHARIADRVLASVSSR